MKKGLFFLLCFVFILPLLGWGQCYNPTYYYRDADGDGFGTFNYSNNDKYDSENDYHETQDGVTFEFNGNIVMVVIRSLVGF